MIIPVGDQNPTRRTPWVTWLLLALNVGIFAFAQPWTDACSQRQFFLAWAAIPAELAQGAPLDAEQVRPMADGCALQPVDDKPVYPAALFSLFLHANWVHVLFNMLYLGIFGNNVEDRLGRVRFLAFYLLGGLVATIAFVVPNLTAPVPLVGASGAVAAVLGAYLVMFPGARVTVWIPALIFVVVPLPAVLVLGVWFLLELLRLQAPDGGVSGGGVAYLAHVAGFLAGVVLVLWWGYRPRRSRRRTPRQP